MKDYMVQRVLEISEYILETKCTVRAAAKKFNVSKSTVHKDLSQRLVLIDPALSKKIKEVLEINKSERHIRGGKATKEKYLRQGNKI